MSDWQVYIDSYLTDVTDIKNAERSAKNVTEHAAIFGMDGAVWAQSSKFQFLNGPIDQEQEDGSVKQVQVNEAANLIDAFENKGLTKKAGGIRINGVKYLGVNFDEARNVFYLKKQGGGACVAKCTQCYVIGTFSGQLKSVSFSGVTEPQNVGLVNKAVEDLQEYFVGNGL